MSFPIFHNFGSLAAAGITVDWAQTTYTDNTDGSSFTTGDFTTSGAYTIVLAATQSDHPESPNITSIVADPGGAGDTITIIASAVNTTGTGREVGCAIGIINRALTSEAVQINTTGTCRRAAIKVVPVSGLTDATAEDSDTDTQGDSATCTLPGLDDGTDALTICVASSIVAETQFSNIDNNESLDYGTLGYAFAYEIDWTDAGGEITATKVSGSGNHVAAGAIFG